MDNDNLKARSIELAERANRLRDKTADSVIKEKFDNTADVLVQIDKLDRFYLAQSVLEKDTAWSEEMRSLAHELNSADHVIKNSKPISFVDAMQTLEEWNKAYLSSTNPEISKVGTEIDAALALLFTNDPESNMKQALDYLISFLETILSHVQTKNNEDKENSTISQLRNMRDAVLVKRELVIDISELVKENENENINANSVELARETLNEIYNKVKPITIVV
jgi:hypothetical protein